MNTTILTTAYFPPISYFAAIAQADNVLIEANEHYQKKSYRSRCYIAGPHGKQMLNIPIDRQDGNQTMISDAKLLYIENWQKQHWNSLITAYNSSPFLLYYQDEIESVFFKKYDTLWELNKELLALILELLQINIPITYTKEYIKSPSEINDYRGIINPRNIYDNEVYIQVFGDKHGFISDLSILDLLFNLGPDASYYLSKIKIKE